MAVSYDLYACQLWKDLSLHGNEKNWVCTRELLLILILFLHINSLWAKMILLNCSIFSHSKNTPWNAYILMKLKYWNVPNAQWIYVISGRQLQCDWTSLVPGVGQNSTGLVCIYQSVNWWRRKVLYQFNQKNECLWMGSILNFDFTYCSEFVRGELHWYGLPEQSFCYRCSFSVLASRCKYTTFISPTLKTKVASTSAWI